MIPKQTKKGRDKKNLIIISILCNFDDKDIISHDMCICMYYI